MVSNAAMLEKMAERHYVKLYPSESQTLYSVALLNIKGCHLILFFLLWCIFLWSYIFIFIWKRHIHVYVNFYAFQELRSYALRRLQFQREKQSQEYILWVNFNTLSVVNFSSLPELSFYVLSRFQFLREKLIKIFMSISSKIAYARSACRDGVTYIRECETSFSSSELLFFFCPKPVFSRSALSRV